MVIKIKTILYRNPLTNFKYQKFKFRHKIYFYN